MGYGDLANDARFRDEAARKANEAALDEIIAAWTSDRDAVEAMNALQTAGVPAGAAHRSVDMLADPHLRARDFFMSLDEPDVGRKTYPGRLSSRTGCLSETGDRPRVWERTTNTY